MEGKALVVIILYNLQFLTFKVPVRLRNLLMRGGRNLNNARVYNEYYGILEKYDMLYEQSKMVLNLQS